MIERKKIKAYTYLKYFPIPFLEDLVRGQVIPFIGAGFSRNADIPKGKEMPDWNKLGELISKDLSLDYEYITPIEAISTYEHEYSRTKLIEKFNELLLTGIIKPGKAHIAFSKIPFELICTTNFDFLIENSFEQLGIYCRPIIDEEQLAINNNNRKDVSLLKFHGDLHHPKRLIATEEDYDSFLNNFPMLATFLANLLITKTCFFIGYSLDDPDFRQVWQLIKDRLGKLRRQAFVISIGSSKQNIQKFERRGVRVINIPSQNKKTYAEILEEVFEELRDFWSKELPNNTTVTDENTKIQLSLDTENYSRLCFFSLPSRYISIYKKYIFPIVENYNFVPITEDEFIQSGDNILATISSLIDKASIIIVDVSSSDSFKTLQMIARTKRTSRKDNVMIISDGTTSSPFENDNSHILRRPENIIDDLDDFVSSFEKHFMAISIKFQASIDDEAKRLWIKNEYAASVISAVTLFEDVLRGKIDKDGEKSSNNLYSLNELLNLATKKQLINHDQIAELKSWIRIRNNFVHTSQRQITKQQAKKIIDSIEKVIKNIRLKT